MLIKAFWTKRFQEPVSSEEPWTLSPSARWRPLFDNNELLHTLVLTTWKSDMKGNAIQRNTGDDWFCLSAYSVNKGTLTCTILLMTIGSMLRGKRRMLKSASDTKAFWASSTLCSSISTYTVKVDRATCTVTRRRDRHYRETQSWECVLMICVSVCIKWDGQI